MIFLLIASSFALSQSSSLLDDLKRIAQTESWMELAEIESELLKPFTAISSEQRSSLKTQFITIQNALFVQRQQIRLINEIEQIKINIKAYEQMQKATDEDRSQLGHNPYPRAWMREQDERDLRQKEALKDNLRKVAFQIESEPQGQLWTRIEDALNVLRRNPDQPFIGVQAHTKSGNGNALLSMNQRLQGNDSSSRLRKQLEERIRQQDVRLNLAFDEVDQKTKLNPHTQQTMEGDHPYGSSTFGEFEKAWGSQLLAAKINPKQAWHTRSRINYDRSAYFTQPLDQDDPGRSLACGGFALAAAMEGELNKKLTEGEVQGLSPWFAYAVARMNEEKPYCTGTESLAFDKVFAGFETLDQGLVDISASMEALSNTGTCRIEDMPLRGVPKQRHSLSGLYRIQEHVSLDVSQDPKFRSYPFLKALVDAELAPILAIDSENSKSIDGWKEIDRVGKYRHVVVLVGYGIGHSAFTGKEVPYFILRDSKGEKPARHYKVPTDNLLEHLTGIHIVRGVEQIR